jgi:hypothetical protein
MSHIRFSRFIILAALVVLMLIPASAAAQIGFGIGFYGPAYPWGYWGGYGYPYGPYAYAPYGYGYGSGRPLGEVKIKSPDSNAQIYINGSLAGRAHDLKRIYLKPGTYNVEQRIGGDVQKQRVYVLAYRSVKIEFGKPGTPSPQPAPPPRDDRTPNERTPQAPPAPAPDADAPR